MAGPATRVRGSVKWFDDTKGYGFIAAEGGGPDVFVHYSAIAGVGRRSLRDGQRVEFEIVQEVKGPRAANVTPPRLTRRTHQRRRYARA